MSPLSNTLPALSTSLRQGVFFGSKRKLLEEREEARGSKRKQEDRGRLLESESSERKQEEARGGLLERELREEARGNKRKLEDRGRLLESESSKRKQEEGCLRARAQRGSKRKLEEARGS